MTKQQISKITIMRERGESYSAIGKELNLSQNTVKSYCVRHNIRPSGAGAEPAYKIGDITKCEQCGAPVEQFSLLRRKRFCYDTCRNKWWNTHPNLVNRRSVYDHTCQHCGKAFRAYGNARRKYCCHECYIAERFGGSDDGE